MSRLPRTLIAAALLATLAGCSSLLGPKETPSIFAPELATTADPAWPSATWALGTVRPTAARILDGSRIAVSPVPGELQVYKGAMWARTPPEMLEEAVLRMLEDSGKIPSVARQGSGIGAEYRLVMDIRHFESRYDAGGTDVALVADAFGQALGTLSREVAGWTLATGNEHQRQPHR